MDNKDNWKIGFKKALIDTLVKNGTPVDQSAQPYGGMLYGYISYDWQAIRKETAEVGIDYDKSSYTESEWHEFMGTFYEGDNRKVGIDATIVLKNGHSHLYRYEGTPSDLILAIVNE